MTNKIFKFPKIHYSETVPEALDAAKGWDFKNVIIVGFVDEYGTPEGTVISSQAKNKVLQAKEYLLMAELLRFQALSALGLINI